ncbi:class I SAM-dependent methyltransferase [Zoogloea sp.]|uniref:class I SAM-dependent methyltransferase n=1 Tax=Zoogloea sp. TaxID=49181 RepID=UPI001415D0FC|nr:MAG: class I SAM-dependent methyltransferase [Zoogloea sp.]
MHDNCRICAHPLLPEPLLIQRQMPAAAQGLPTAERLADDAGVDLALRQCGGCGLVQLPIAPVPYWREVIRAAGISPEMRAFRLDQFGRWIGDHGLAGRKVLEVGCGHGEYLALLGEAGADACGIEHAAAAVDACQAAGLRVSQGFIDGPETRLDDGPFDGFAILNFLEHIPTAHLTLRGIAANLKPGATGLVEVPDFDMILRTRLFAEFIPDHLYYFTRQSLTHLLEGNGFEVLECRSEWHGYVLSATVRKRAPLDLSALQDAQAAVKASFDAFLDRFEAGRVAIWGAGHQALALISLLGIAPRIRYVLDSAPFKQGRFTPASHLPIVAPERLAAAEVDAVIVLAASYSDEVARIIGQRHGTRFQVAVLRNDGLHAIPPGEAEQ